MFRFFTIFLSIFCFIGFVNQSYSAQIFADDFEQDTIGKLPQKWVEAYEGTGDPEVIEDPIRKGNKVFSTPQDRHDVGGAIFTAGEEYPTGDYIVQWEMLFPIDFYLGIVFRFSGPESFYLLDRRQADKFMQFWKRQDAVWTAIANSPVLDVGIEKWFAFQLEVSGDTFSAKMKEADDTTPFNELEPIVTGTDTSFDEGVFGNYGYSLLDNVIIGEDESDFVMSVNPKDKLSTTWSKLKGYKH